MAELAALRGLRYDPERAGPLSSLVAPPYDVITPDELDRLYAKSPYNVVRVDLPRSEPGDSSPADRYARAGRLWSEWRRVGVLRPEPEPVLYAYHQRYRHPDGGERRLTGVVGALRLSRWDERIVFPHEHTFARPKADRLALMRATRANLSPIYAFFSDPAREVDAALAASGLTPAGDAPPGAGAVLDADGAAHVLWPITDRALLTRIAAVLAELPVFIADGHHRYETALDFRDEGRATRAHAPVTQPGGKSATGAEYVLAMLVNLDGGGITILPTHRIVRRFPGYDRATFLERLRRFFHLSQLPAVSSLDAPLTASTESREPECVVYLEPGEALQLRLKDPAAAAPLLDPALSPASRRLDVTLWHAVILSACLGLQSGDLAGGDLIAYTRSRAEAAAAVRAGTAALAIIMRAPGVEQVRDVALAGDVMPHKSTYFYPKLLTGLVFADLDQPVYRLG